MPKKNLENEKNIGELVKIITPISVVNKKQLKPYIELFEFQPENIIQKPLGKLVGVFEIKDFSEESSYVVNFLTSVVRKEYYVNSRRPTSESLESALHKINVALSELVEHGNIKWIGQFDAAVCVIEKNLLHFSVTGSARVMLIRSGNLTDISEGLEPESDEAHPIKTFVNISSGKMETGDRIIITTGDIFEIFSPTEIKKASRRFTGEKFVQFIKTALINELDLAGTLIIEVQDTIINDKIKKKKAADSTQESVPNVFSEYAFQKVKKKEKGGKLISNTSAKKDFTDNKTGHIYLQEELADLPANNQLEKTGDFLKEKMLDFSVWIRRELKIIRPKLKKMFISAGFLTLTLIRRLKYRFQDNVKNISIDNTEKSSTPHQNKTKPENKLEKKKINVFLNIRKIFPDWNKIRILANRFNYQQKIVVIIILILIAIIPFILSKIKQPDNKIEAPAEKIPLIMTNNQVLINDKNIDLNAQISELLKLENPVKTILMQNRLFVISGDRVIAINNDAVEKEYPASPGLKFVDAAPMDDLNLIFLISDNKQVFSFSPISQEFKENNIVFPENIKIEKLSTYLTFLYLVDGNNNKIYRYPRAEGGFGTKVDWLKDQTSVNDTSDMAIDDNVYLAQNKQMIKLFKGLKQEFSIEPTNTPIIFSKIFTNSDIQNIYVLDSSNGRVIKLSKSGEIISQYYSELLEKARDFSVDEKNNQAYIITEKNQLAKLVMN
jgi:hypothetical protein